MVLSKTSPCDCYRGRPTVIKKALHVVEHCFGWFITNLMSCLWHQGLRPGSVQLVRDWEHGYYCHSLPEPCCLPLFPIGSQNLEEVLGTLVQGAVGFPDPAVRDYVDVVFM